jgi:hypothetical protein
VNGIQRTHREIRESQTTGLFTLLQTRLEQKKFSLQMAMILLCDMMIVVFYIYIYVYLLGTKQFKKSIARQA